LPDSYGKRRRNQVKAKKATARDERRVARNERRARRAAGIFDEEPPMSDSEEEAGLPDEAEAETGAGSDENPEG
jgi:hypothetical protein